MVDSIEDADSCLLITIVVAAASVLLCGNAPGIWLHLALEPLFGLAPTYQCSTIAKEMLIGKLQRHNML